MPGPTNSGILLPRRLRLLGCASTCNSRLPTIWTSQFLNCRRCRGLGTALVQGPCSTMPSTPGLSLICTHVLTVPLLMLLRPGLLLATALVLPLLSLILLLLLLLMPPLLPLMPPPLLLLLPFRRHHGQRLTRTAALSLQLNLRPRLA